MLKGVQNCQVYDGNRYNKKSTVCRNLGAAAGAAGAAAYMYNVSLQNSFRPSRKKGIKGVMENLKSGYKNLKDMILNGSKSELLQGKDITADTFRALKKNSKTYKNLKKIFDTKLGRAGLVGLVLATPVLIGAGIGKMLGWFGDKAVDSVRN